MLKGWLFLRIQLYEEWIHYNLPTVLLNWLQSILITFDFMTSEVDCDTFPRHMNTSIRWFDSYRFWIYWRADCERHQIQTTTVSLFSWELMISTSSPISRLTSLLIWCDIWFFCFLSSCISWWSTCGSMHAEPQLLTLSFITTKIRKDCKYQFKCVDATLVSCILLNH